MRGSQEAPERSLGSPTVFESSSSASAPLPLMADSTSTALMMTAPKVSQQKQQKQQKQCTMLHEALRCPQLRDLVDGLRPETQREIIRGMAGLPFGFKVRRE